MTLVPSQSQDKVNQWLIHSFQNAETRGRHPFRLEENGYIYEVLLLNMCKNIICFVEVLRPCQQLWSCRAGQLPINTVPGQA